MAWEIKKDCFAYNEICESCKALDDLYYAKEKCSFYKPGKSVNQTNKTNEFYRNRLQQWFDRYYGKYAGSAEFYPDPSYNIWEFYIPEMNQIITLTCSHYGRITTNRREVNE